jgi:hypothetical protein
MIGCGDDAALMTGFRVVKGCRLFSEIQPRWEMELETRIKLKSVQRSL